MTVRTLRRMKMENNPPKPIFPFDNDERCDDSWIEDDEICTNCNVRICEHTSGEAVRCALEIIKGGTRRS